MALTTNTVLYEKKDRTGYITLNRPEAMNALNTEERRGIWEAVHEVASDDDVLVAIMTGAGGKAFCAGMDLKERARMDAGAAPDDAGGLPTGGRPDPVWSCPKPIIAAIDGFAIAGGMQLAARCDIRIATTKSRFGMPEARRSLTPVGTVDTPERFLPLGEALYILLSGTNTVTAERLYQLGWLQFLAPDRDALMAKAEEVAEEIKMCAPLAVRALKYIAKEGRYYGIEVSSKIGLELKEAVARSEDRLEGPKAFAEKRAPQWQNR